jgi:hypothetical protein
VSAAQVAVVGHVEIEGAQGRDVIGQAVRSQSLSVRP